MNKLVITKDKVYFAVMFLIIYCSHDTLMFGTNANNLFITARKIIPFLLGALLFMMDLAERKKYKAKEFICGLLFMALPLLSCAVNHEPWDNYIYRFAIMFCAFLLAMSNYKEKACKYYCSIMVFLSIWSFAVFAIANLLPGLLSRFPTIVNSQGFSYANAIFSVATKSKTYGVMRNHCIFREPGVYVVFLTIAFLFEILKGDPKTKTKHIIIFTVAMLTTMSTAGYIILAAIYIYLILCNRDLKHKPAIVITICAAVLVLVTQTSLLQADSAMFSKFDTESNSYGSWFSRLSSLVENLRIAMNNPAFGVGRYSLYDIVLAKDGNYTAVDNTNTIMIGFAAYGIGFGLLLMWGCWKFIRKKRKIIIFDALLFLILFMALSNEDMGQNIIFYFIVLAGFFSRGRDDLGFCENRNAERLNERRDGFNEVCLH